MSAESWAELLADWLDAPAGSVSRTEAMDFRGFVMDEVTFTDDRGWSQVLENHGWSFPSSVPASWAEAS